MFQPDIAPNVGATMRLCACMDVGLDVIEPCGFPWDAGKIRKAGMDYVEAVDLRRHDSWEDFVTAYPSSRIILMTTKGSVPYTEFAFEAVHELPHIDVAFGEVDSYIQGSSNENASSESAINSELEQNDVPVDAPDVLRAVG